MRSAFLIFVLLLSSVCSAEMFNSPWKQTVNDDGTIVYSFAGGGTLTVTSSFDAESGITSNNFVFATSDPPSDTSDYYGSGLPYGEGAATSIIYPDGYDWQTISSSASINYDPSTQESSDDSDDSGTTQTSQNVNVNVEFPDEMTVTGKVEVDIKDQVPTTTHPFDGGGSITVDRNNGRKTINLDEERIHFEPTYLDWSCFQYHDSLFYTNVVPAYGNYDLGITDDRYFHVPSIKWEDFKKDLKKALFGTKTSFSEDRESFEIPGFDSLDNPGKSELQDFTFTVYCPFGGSFQYLEVALPFNSWSKSSIVPVLRGILAFFVYLETGFMISSILIKRS